MKPAKRSDKKNDLIKKIEKIRKSAKPVSIKEINNWKKEGRA